MLYYLSLLEGTISELRLFQYITVRTLGAAATAFVISLLIAPWLIKRLMGWIKAIRLVRRRWVVC